MEEATPLQASAFEWDGDEERFAMEKVHGVNDFDNEDQTKFSTMNDELDGDDDWRVLAASHAQSEQQQPATDEVAAMETDPLPSPPPPPSSSTTRVQPSLRVSTPHSTQVADLRIMRFTRKRTPSQRGRRTPTLPLLMMLQDREAAEKKAATPKSEGVTATTTMIPSVKKVETSKPATETKSVTVKASSAYGEAVEKDAKAQRSRQAEAEKRGIRPKPQQQQPSQQKSMEEQQQNRKPKALAFEKSRNMINKRINADSVKAEPALEVECPEVAAMQAKQKAVAAEFKALKEEIRPLISGEGEGVKDVPPALQERWFDLHCKQLRSNFDFHFTMTQHFLCHPSSGQCKGGGLIAP